MGTTQTTDSTAVARTDEKGIRALLVRDDVRVRIEPFLMPGASYDRVMAGAHYAARQNPQILECTPHSIIDAVARIQQWQLEIGTTAHLVPFNVKVSKNPDKWAKVCTPIADYKGLAELMRRSGAVRHVEARVVYKGDQFSYTYGLDAQIQHVPNMAAKDRGAIIFAYVILRLPFGAASFEVMSIEDIDEIRKKHSKQWKDGPCPAWYAKKTVVRQAAKLVPKDPRFAAALRVIEDEEAHEFGEPPLLSGQTMGALPAGQPDDEMMDTVRQNQTKALRNIPTVEYMPESGVASTGRMSPEAIAEIANRPDPYAVDPGDPRFGDTFPEDDLFPDTKTSARTDALREG